MSFPGPTWVILFALACGPRPGVMVQFEGDLEVPRELTAVRLEVAQAGTVLDTTELKLAGPLPQTVALLSEGKTSGRLDFSARGLRGGQEVASARTTGALSSGRPLQVVQLVLLRSCADADEDSFGDFIACAADAAKCAGCRNTSLDCDDTDPRHAPGAPEVCGNQRDDDCDGEVDEGCACSPGAGQGCYGGPAATRGVGACIEGRQTCGANGTFDPCVGQVLPKAEVCGNQKDDDCNGRIDDGCA